MFTQTSKNKYSGDTPAMGLHGAGLGPKRILFPQASHCKIGTILLPPQSWPWKQSVHIHTYLNMIRQMGADLAESRLPVAHGG